MRENTIRSRWARGEAVLNGWLHLPHAFAAEVMAHQGYDSLTIDMQHGPIGFEAALGMLQAIATTAVMPLARVRWNEPGTIMQMLDAGCYGIICPMISSPAECAAFVAACRYPPHGYRSTGPVRAAYYAGGDYSAHADATVIAMAMIETRGALDNLDAILSTPGLDAVYIGPADLAQSLGFPGHLDPTEPVVVDAITHVIARGRAHGVVVGMHCGSPAYARAMVTQGMQFVTVGSDARFLADGARAATGAFRQGEAAPERGVY